MKIKLGLLVIMVISAALLFAQGNNPAVPITPGESHNASLGQGAGHWYSFTIDSFGNLEMWTESAIDTMLWLFSEDMQEIAFDDDSGKDFNAHLIEFVTPGTYYILVKGYSDHSGPYTLHCEVYFIPQH